MIVVQTNVFKRMVKKLHTHQKADLDKAVKDIINHPKIGQLKTGDLSDVYKFKMVNQLTLLAYMYENQTVTLTLLALGSHENFYRDLKRTV